MGSGSRSQNPLTEQQVHAEITPRTKQGLKASTNENPASRRDIADS